MIDIVDKATRSRIMAQVKSKNTKPEIIVRRFLHRLGYRFRLHRGDLPGSPDIVLPKYKIVVFVHGCFWHKHASCYYATAPATRADFWEKKLNHNVIRDAQQIRKLNESGWRVMIIWECGLKHNPLNLDKILNFFNTHEPLYIWPSTPPKPISAHKKIITYH